MMLALLVLSFAVQPELRAIDAGTSDVSVNSESRLVPRVDQRKPLGFDQVFELTKPNGERVFVRRSGNLYAEFSRSVYTASGSPDVPPGTVFRIGDPIAEDTTEVAPAANRVSLAVSMRADDDGRGARSTRGTGAGSAALPVGAPSIVGNELYRQLRISQLLMSTVKPETSEP
ncbi:MAG: hypothetical protein AAFO89_01325 [Planctomycetota bacterium]